MKRSQFGPDDSLLFEERYRGSVVWFRKRRLWLLTAVEYGQFAVGFQIVRTGVVLLAGPFAVGVGVHLER